jgi:uncharacterized protein YggE
MGTVTVSVRAMVLAAVAALAVVAAYVVGGAAQGTASPAPAAADTSTDQARTIQVVGKGTATVVPDQLAFTVTVTARRDALDDALAAANATMGRVLGVLGKQGVAKTDTQTTGLSMNPEYYYPNSGPPVLTGYRVTQRLRVTVTELAQGGSAISAVVEAGDGVKVSAIQLVVGDPEAAVAKARDAAVAEAKAKAEQYAAATGASLGDVATIREVSAPANRPQPVFQRAAAYKDLAGAVPIRAGESDLTVRVQVVWSLD